MKPKRLRRRERITVYDSMCAVFSATHPGVGGGVYEARVRHVDPKVAIWRASNPETCRLIRAFGVLQRKDEGDLWVRGWGNLDAFELRARTALLA